MIPSEFFAARRKAMAEWVTENGLDPSVIPESDNNLHVDRAGRTISVDVLVRSRTGGFARRGNAFVRARVTVPLVTEHSWWSGRSELWR